LPSHDHSLHFIRKPTYREATLRAILTALLLIVATAAQAQCNRPWDRPWDARYDLRDMWLKASDCRYIFPKNDGFAGVPRTVRLKAGTMLDRYGHPGGRFLAPADASYMGRAVPYDRLKMDYYRYEVVRPVRVKAGKATPWFDQPGGVIQYKTAQPVQVLIGKGYLKQTW
jgi:nicrotizing toxin Mtb-like protein